MNKRLKPEEAMRQGCCLHAKSFAEVARRTNRFSPSVYCNSPKRRRAWLHRSGSEFSNTSDSKRLELNLGQPVMQLYQSIGGTLLVTALASSAHPQSDPLPQWKLQASRDSFVININGKTTGYSVLAVERVPGGGFRVTEQTEIGDVMRQKTELLLDAAQRTKRVHQAGKLRDQNARIAIEYLGNYVTGAATLPTAEGVQSFMINTAVPANVIDDNLLHSIFPVLPWSSDADWTIPVFSAGKNRLANHQLVVTGTEIVTISSGNVEAYRAEMRGDEMTLVIWVRKARPHRVLKTAALDVSFEMVLVN
jgi:hypothetical protein